MSTYRRTPDDAGTALRQPPCPRCNGSLMRVRRHFADRMVSLFSPVRRYRCDSFACRWEGTLPARRAGPAAMPKSRPSEP